MNLKNKISVVTGGSSGIGKAISIALSNEGSKVIFTYNSNEKGADDTLKELGESGFKFKVDLREEKDIKNLFNFVEERFGKLDILVNNAANNKAGEIFDLDIWQKAFETNVIGIVATIKHAAKLMKEGKILNISSIYAEDKTAWQGKAGYAASKASVNNLTRTFAKHFAPNILVNSIAPGYVDTESWNEFPKEVKERSKAEQLIMRMIRPDEIAQMAVAVIKNDAMTGEIVVVDGGISLKTV